MTFSLNSTLKIDNKATILLFCYYSVNKLPEILEGSMTSICIEKAFEFVLSTSRKLGQFRKYLLDVRLRKQCRMSFHVSDCVLVGVYQDERMLTEFHFVSNEEVLHINQFIVLLQSNKFDIKGDLKQSWLD